MTTRYRPSVDVRNECPYCGFKFTIEARDITGELHALRCLGCHEKFIVEVLVDVSHKIDPIAGVAADDVLDRLSNVDEPDPGIADGESALEQIEEDLDGIPAVTDVVFNPVNLTESEIEELRGSRGQPSDVHSVNVREKPRKPPPPMTSSSIIGSGVEIGPGLKYKDR
jgi:hypothetical protein